MAIQTAQDQEAKAAEAFIARWQGHEGGQERANYALFLTELCDILGLPHPDVANATHEFNDYVFERSVRKNRDEGESIGRIDLYKKNSFVLEAKQSRWKGEAKELAGQNDLFDAGDEQAERGKRGANRAWDVLMLNAKRQAEEYARALPASHGWPPFILVCDVGHCIEVYADFSGQGKNYTQFPDRQGYRVYLDDLRKDDVRERLKAIWLDPQSLDPTRKAAKATRDIAARLAEVSKALEAKKYPPEEVAQFLMRCLFTMFAASVKLLPENSFRDLLADCRNNPDAFLPLLTELWQKMNVGEYSTSIRAKVLQFNGNLFANAKVLPLGREEIGELCEAAQKDWHEVEPAIFGTLLEQALDPAERRRLGAHYTPRAYVERLVLATIIEPLRDDWRNVQAAAETKRAAGHLKGAAAEVKAFHDKLCATRVLDPACGTGNFLYVAMELMKRLEGEVLEALLDLGGQEALRGLGGHTVDPHQFLGLEINPRAAAIAELVLWIGYLQWHFRIKGGQPEPPILKKFKNIEVKNAVLTWDGYPVPQTIDRKEAYPHPKRPTWPTADFIVGNPPFMGGKDIRGRLGDACAEALWEAHDYINESADFVMYWWDRAADILTSKGTALRRFGLVTTNSITQEFSRRVMKKRMENKHPTSIVMAIPDHPWTKVTDDAAAVRIAMTVAEAGALVGLLREVVEESLLDTDEPTVRFRESMGKINSDLTIGTDITSVRELLANAGLCYRGMQLMGAGFIVTPSEATVLGLGKRAGLENYIKPYRNGRDITASPRGALVIDLFGIEIEEVRKRFPEVYQHLKSEVKEKTIINDKGETEYVGRDWNNRESYRQYWWVFGEPRRELRPGLSGLKKYVITVETMQHRSFQFLDADILPDNRLVVVATSDSYLLGVLSSSIHICWTLKSGGTLEDRPIYTKSRCFDSFPFPSPSDLLKDQIRTAAEELDAFRKQRQKEYPSLTLTQMYNVLEKLRANAELDEDDERIKNNGLILILKELHDKIDRLVFQAYGWPEALSDEQILERLVALNHERAAEERRGHVRWLRPEYQIPRFGKDVDKMAAREEGAQITADLGLPPPIARKLAFPSDAVEQTAAVFAALAAAGGPVSAPHIAQDFRKTKNLEETIAKVLSSLARLGHVSTKDGRTFEIKRVA
jgi:hypothetical protein